MSKQPSQDFIMTPADAANFIGIAPRTLARWHQQRFGPPRIKVGRRVLYRRECVLEWLVANEQVPVRSSYNDRMR